MCLVAVAWRAHAEFPLIVAGNRDEYHQRPSAAADWWADCPGVYGGRDMVAGGSWLAINRRGRLAVVTNYPSEDDGLDPELSRGHLVGDFVRGADSSLTYLDAVAASRHRYAGFCLIVASVEGVRAMASPSRNARSHWALSPGTFTVSNSPLERPWPKAAYLDTELQRVLHSEAVTPEVLFDVLAEREAVGADASEPQLARTPFVTGEDYGTRAMTVVIVNHAGQIQFAERRFDRNGALSGESLVSFQMEAGVD